MAETCWVDGCASLVRVVVDTTLLCGRMRLCGRHAAASGCLERTMDGRILCDPFALQRAEDDASRQIVEQQITRQQRIEEEIARG